MGFPHWFQGLHYAVKKGQIEVLELNAENVSDKDPGDQPGMTPLRIATA